jgi:thiamine-phosphate pyrophosphorylase
LEDADTRCRIYIEVRPGPGAADRLHAALDQVDAAAVLVRPRGGDKLGAGDVKPLVDIAQKAGVAAVLAEDAALARTLRADGVHLEARPDMADRLAEARSILGSGAIIGVDPGHSRHAAMEAGEAGADYIAFGIGAATSTPDTAKARRDEFLAWWAELFEVPCVALDIADAREAADLAALGVEFVVAALDPEDGADAAARRVAGFQEAIDEVASCA